MLQKIRQINFRQPKYMLPAVIYFPVLFCGYFVIELFHTEKAEVRPSQLETTEYLNDKLPEASIKGDGIGDKFGAMLDEYGRIKDLSAVENVERETQEKEEFDSRYTDADIAAMQAGSQEQQEALQKLNELQEQIRQASDRTGTGLAATEEEEALQQLQRTLAQARQSTYATGAATQPRDTVSPSHATATPVENVIINENAVTEISEETATEEVARKQRQTSDYFQTIIVNEPQDRLVKAIIDEEVRAQDGSRVRLRLLDDIEISGRTIPAGSYLYMQMSGFNQQRVKGTVSSILYQDELVKVSLSVYDIDGMEGLYVPKSAFRETAKDVGSGAFNNSMMMNSGSYGSNVAQWGMQTLQNAYQKTSRAISKAIKRNTVRLKYGTQVFLINTRDKNKKTNQ